MIGDRYIQSPLMTYVRCRGHVRQALDVARTRLIFAGTTLSLLLACVLFRLVDITVFQSDEAYVMDTHKKAGLQTARTNIVDRNGELLATTLITGSLFANAQVIQNPQLVAKKLQPFVDMEPEKLVKILSSQKRFVWIQRHLTPKQQADIIRLGIPGLDIMRDERRVYPHGDMTAHVLGMTDIDNQGISGVEKTMDKHLRTGIDALKLSIDVRIQNILFEELQKGMKEYRARAVNGLILDVRTGEILAMASLPSFNPNVPQKVDYDKVFDRNVNGVYELGSIFKIINTALALESGNASVHKLYDATKPLKVGSRFRITDLHAKNRWLSVSEIFQYSSNIGSGLMALEAGVDAQKAFINKMGLLSPASIELPGSGSPLYPRHWSEANAITISYGYAISVAPVRFAAAVASLLRGGIQLKPTILYQGNKNYNETKRLVTPQTSAQLRALMRLTTTQGTARKADIPGYVVIGKTGTAMQLLNGKYQEGVLTTSYIGTLGRKLNKPKYLILVTYDRPKETKDTYGFRGGGWNATPTARKIMEKMISVLGLRPSHSTETQTDHDINSLIHLAGMEM